MSFFHELKRRNVFRMLVLYVVAAWLLLQVTDVFSSLLNLPDWTGSMVVFLLVLAFPVVLMVSWIYELTPDGIKLEKDVDRSGSIVTPPSRKIDVLIIALLLVAIAVVLIDRLLPEQPAAVSPAAVESANPSGDAEAAEGSIAVLPFANRSAREEDRFFVDGIHDDILNQLANIDSLTVISRTSVEKFRETRHSIGEIGELLGVKNILEGGIQRDGDRVRINIQLIDVASDDRIWVESFDRELTPGSIFGIQSEIAAAVANALEAALSPEEQARLTSVPTENMQALEAYFLGKQELARRTSESLKRAAAHFARAIELDPEFALAYVGQADSYSLQVHNGDLSPREAHVLVDPLIERALALDDELGVAYAVRGEDFTYLGMHEAADTAFRRALELAPKTASVHHAYSMFLRSLGQNEAGLKHIRIAIKLDPLSKVLQVNLGTILLALNRPSESIAQLNKVIAMDEAYPVPYWSIGGILWMRYGKLDEALGWFEQSQQRNPGNSKIATWMALLHLDLGNLEDAERQMGQALAQGPNDSFSIWAQELIALYKGDRVRAAEYAAEVINQDPSWPLSLINLANFDLQAGDPDRAAARYRKYFPALFDEAAPTINRTNLHAAIHLGLILPRLGQTERAQMLLNRALDDARSNPLPRLRWYPLAYGIPQTVQIFALQGKPDAALAALQDAVDDGWRALWWYWLEHDPSLEAMRDEPGFMAIVETIRSDIAAQRGRVASERVD